MLMKNKVQEVILDIQEDINSNSEHESYDDWDRGYYAALRGLKIKLENIIKESSDENQDH
jgi:hypothetical protein